jgi:aspartate aminotransferase
VEMSLEARVDVNRYEARRNMMVEILEEAGFSVRKPGGGFYVFAKSPVDDDIAFAAACARHLVLLVPGSGFGCPGYFRICFAASEKSILGSAAAFKDIGREFGLC